MRQEVGIDALAGVGNADLEVTICPLQAHLHLAALGRELDRVGDEVPNHLLEAAGVAGHRPGRRIEHDVQAQSPRIRGRPQRIDRRLDEPGWLQRLHVQAQLAGGDPIHVEQIVDHLRLHPRVTKDGVEPFEQVGLLRVSGGLEDVRPPQDGVQRRA